MGWSTDVCTSIIFLFLVSHNVEERECTGINLGDLKIEIPSIHTTSSGDLLIKIYTSSLPALLVQLFKLEESTVLSLVNLTIPQENIRTNTNVTLFPIPCGYFSKGGKYYVLVRKIFKDEISSDVSDDQYGEESPIITQTVDVQWTMPKIDILPEYIQTYPKTPVIAMLEFPEILCPSTVNHLMSSTIPEFQLELHFCGHSPSVCDDFSRSNQSFQNLHTEQVRAFPGKQNITLKCEYFGLAGHYALFIRTISPTSFPTHKAVYIKADWSEEFVFNVHAQSIFPCDRHNGGITVLFQYPACILLTGDRVRVFARQRAEVASLVPPTSLEYVAEQKVRKGSNKLKFDCDLFSEHYIEYCFVYVSQAITGAVADVRMDCVSTLPIRETKSGGWGPWSSWTPCSSTCIGGTRSRFRLCDSPIPRFGGKFCEGRAVETEKCGFETNIWECFGGNFDQFEQAIGDTPSIKEEVGLYCRCGCVVHLGRANPRRILATSFQSCPGRIFWQVQADPGCIVQFKIDWFKSTCGVQWMKIRDGMSLSSNLLAAISDVLDSRATIVNSTGPTMLLEFFTDEYPNSGKLCGGGFLAYARQIDNINISAFSIQRTPRVSRFFILKLTAIHSTVIFFLSGILIAMTLLAAQYTFRYRKYHIALTEDHDSMADLTVSCATLISRRSSNATLFSEVQSLQCLAQQVMLDPEEKQTEKMQENTTESDKSNETNKPENTEDELSPSKSSMEIHAKSSADEVEDRISEKVSNVSGDGSPETDQVEKDVSEKEFHDSNIPTPAKGCYSSSRRLISRAKIRNTIPKEAKEKKNREKLLVGACGSDFSLSCGDVDLEIDYYDYNVRNAGAAPGSYLGMDPAFLVYIPPLYGSREMDLDDDNEEDLEQNSTKSNVQSEEYLERERNSFIIKRKNSEIYKSKEDNYEMAIISKEYTSRSNEELKLDNQPVIYESKYARKQLQDLSECNNAKKTKTKIEEFAMIDSNILDEIRYVDDDDDEKH